jgi:hypothetical protein
MHLQWLHYVLTVLPLSIASYCRDQIVNDEAHLATEARKQDAMAKCMAAPALALPLPTAVEEPEDDLSADGPKSRRKGRKSKANKFLLPTPIATAEPDVPMAEEEGQPDERCAAITHRGHASSSVPSAPCLPWCGATMIHQCAGTCWPKQRRHPQPSHC